MGANPNLECSAAALESCAPQALSGKTERTAKLRETFVIPNNPQIPEISGWENIIMTDVPTVYQIPGDKKYYMSFVGFDGSCYQSFVAESTDLFSWTGFRLAMGCEEEGPDEGGVVLYC